MAELPPRVLQSIHSVFVSRCFLRREVGESEGDGEHGLSTPITDLTPQPCGFQQGQTSRVASSPSPHFTEEETETQKGVVICLGSQGGFQWLKQSALVWTAGTMVPTSGAEAPRR